MGRFPAELPEHLPAEQVTLMAAYLEVLAEDRRDHGPAGSPHQHVADARRAEAALAVSEADAWRTTRPARG